jgi:hypothetical protein
VTNASTPRSSRPSRAIVGEDKHLAVHDAGRFRRIMRRVQIAGDTPV